MEIADGPPAYIWDEWWWIGWCWVCCCQPDAAWYHMQIWFDWMQMSWSWFTFTASGYLWYCCSCCNIECCIRLWWWIYYGYYGNMTRLVRITWNPSTSIPSYTSHIQPTIQSPPISPIPHPTSDPITDPTSTDTDHPHCNCLFYLFGCVGLTLFCWNVLCMKLGSCMVSSSLQAFVPSIKGEIRLARWEP